MSDYIDIDAPIDVAAYDCNRRLTVTIRQILDSNDARYAIADVVEVPHGQIGEISDGYHTFNGLYYQRMVLFAALVNAYKDLSWKSRRHADGQLCFGGGWFIVGIDTPEGSYTYHYEEKYYDLFLCDERAAGKTWDGHTEKDVTRLLSLYPDPSFLHETHEDYYEGSEDG